MASATSHLSHSRAHRDLLAARLSALPTPAQSLVSQISVPASWADPSAAARRTQLRLKKRMWDRQVVADRRALQTSREQYDAIANSSVPAVNVDLGCPDAAPAGVLRDGATLDVCTEAMRLARTPSAAAAISYAFAQLGDAYTFTTRATGDTYDCSSLVARAYRDGAGVGGFFSALPNTAGYATTSAQLSQVNVSQARPGDIIIWYRDTIANSGGLAGHAQLYLGDGWIIQSGGGGDSRVNVDRFNPGDWKYVVFAVNP